MAAPNLQTLLDVETEAERALSTYLEAVLMPVIKSDSDEELQTPRLGLVATLLREGGQVWQQTTGIYSGRYFWVQKFVRISLELTYSPAAGQGQGNMRGLLRAALSDYDSIIAEFGTNGYYIPPKATILQTDGDRTIDNGEKTETISTTLEMQLWMQPSAIPLS